MKKAAVLMAVLSVVLLGGDLHPKWLDKYRFMDEPYKGASVTDEEMGSSHQHDVVFGEHISMGVFHGLYRNSIFKLTGGKEPQKKIVITQAIPCYIVPKGWDRKKWLGRKAKKINNTTVEIIKEGNGGVQSTLLNGNMRRGFPEQRLDYTGKNYGRLVLTWPKKIDASNSKIILGDSFSCLKQENKETWRVYWKLNGEWVLMAEETFHIIP